MSQTYGINYTKRQKLVNLNYQINKVIFKNYKKHVPRSRCWRWSTTHYHCVEIHRSAVQLGYNLREIGN